MTTLEISHKTSQKFQLQINKMKVIKSLQRLALAIIVLGIISCQNINSSDKRQLTIARTSTNKTIYQLEDEVALNSFEISNSKGSSVQIDSIFLVIGTTDSNGQSRDLVKLLGTGYEIMPRATLTIPKTNLPEAATLKISGFLVHIELIFSHKKEEHYLTFFRKVDSQNELTYDIKRTDFNGLSVFELQGGLSAEYTVQKAVASLMGGMSHSWNVPEPGKGPVPISSSADFLQRSVEKTIDFYNKTLGSNTPIETVIMTTGIPSASYLARAMNAPALPIHFLVGTHTTKEIQTILDYSETNGVNAYATIGHDYSLSESQAVAWIKMLSIPPAYKQFLIDHNVEQIVFNGALGKGGESGARKLKDNHGHYNSGSIYLMHFAGAESEKYLGQTIRDLDTAKLEPFGYIADWEAGVIESQIDSIAGQIRNETQIDSIHFLTTKDAIHLWDMGSYMMLHLLDKNQMPLKGISLNPYLIGHPVFETYNGYIPFLYWQGIEPQYHIDNRLRNRISEAIDHYYPGKPIENLTYWVNSTNNFGGLGQGKKMSEVLKRNGFNNVVENNYKVAEVWNQVDGMNSAVEVRTQQLVSAGLRNLKDWNNNLIYLTIEDLNKISEKFPDILIISK